MSNVDEDVGHTVVHFLYTGGYETVSSPLDEGTSDLAREYKRSVLVYHASRTWGLTDLEILSKQMMQRLDEEVPIIEMLRVMRDVFSSLPADETWFPGYIQGNLQRLLKPDDPGLGLRQFYNILGQDHQFDNAVTKMIIEILSLRLFSMKDQHAKILNGTISEESPLQGPVPEETESVPDELEPAPEEIPAEGDSEQWIIPQVSADADGWPRASLLPGDMTKTEILQEALDQGHLARISCTELNLPLFSGNQDEHVCTLTEHVCTLTEHTLSAHSDHLCCEILSEQEPDRPHKAAAPKRGIRDRGLKSGHTGTYVDTTNPLTNQPINFTDYSNSNNNDLTSYDLSAGLSIFTFFTHPNTQ
ncbi:hypothetical protein VN97_g1202 [Penicillium thymicola]|uniref:Uncharacterized protein n=1 Tax=Penicillium thymicola TaxID=293382 RepID=A0AAI9XCX1_PENTH|nr:hypothetical protein VN97_g1202 [Penicillium thymicola]